MPPARDAGPSLALVSSKESVLGLDPTIRQGRPMDLGVLCLDDANSERFPQRYWGKHTETWLSERILAVGGRRVTRAGPSSDGRR